MKREKSRMSMKGITLIALVVTIVVLLILAGVSISMLTGENGIITQSQEAKLETRAAMIQEERDLWIKERYLTQKTNETPKSMEKILQELQDKGELSAEEVETIKNDPNNSITIGSKTISFKVIEELKPQIGDYVNYTYDTAENYVLTQETCGARANPAEGIPQTAGLKWRILNINEDGSMDLISAAPTSTSIWFGLALGYNNGIYLINDICAKQYSNSSLGIFARNLTIEDIESKMNETGIAARNIYKHYGTQYGSKKTYTVSNSYYPNLYAQENGSGINTTIVKTNGIGRSDQYYSTLTTETYLQASSSGITVTQDYYKFDDMPSSYFDDSNFYQMIFGTGQYYWLASRCSYCWSTDASFGLRRVHGSELSGFYFFSSNTGTSSDNNRLRPVVTLKPNIIDTNLGKDENGAWQIVTTRDGSF